MKDNFFKPGIIHFGCNGLFEGLLSIHIKEEIKVLCCHIGDYETYRSSLNQEQILFDGLNGNTYELSEKHYEQTYLKYDNFGYNLLKEAFVDENLIALSFSLEKKEIKLTKKNKELKEEMVHDIYCNPQEASSIFGMLCYFLYLRYCYLEEGITIFPFCTSLSLQQEIKKNIIFIAEKWLKEGYVDDGFIDYLRESVVLFSTYVDIFVDKPRIKILQLLHYNRGTKKHNYGSSVFAIEKYGRVLVEENAFVKAIFTNSDILNYGEIDEINMAWKICNDKIKNPILSILQIVSLLENEENLSLVAVKPEWQWLCYGIGMEGIVYYPRYKAYLNELIQFRLVEYKSQYYVDIKDIIEDLRDFFEDTIYEYKKHREEKNLFFIPLFIAIVLRFLLLTDDKLKDIKIELANTTRRVSNRICTDVLHLLYSEKCFDFCWNENILNKIVLFFEEMCKGKDAVIRTLYYFKEVREEWTS